MRSITSRRASRQKPTTRADVLLASRVIERALRRERIETAGGRVVAVRELLWPGDPVRDRPDDADGRVAIEDGAHAPEPTRSDEGVVVEEEDGVAPGDADAVVAPGRESAVREVENGDDVATLLGEPSEPGRGLVG